MNFNHIAIQRQAGIIEVRRGFHDGQRNRGRRTQQVLLRFIPPSGPVGRAGAAQFSRIRRFCKTLAIHCVICLWRWRLAQQDSETLHGKPNDHPITHKIHPPGAFTKTAGPIVSWRNQCHLGDCVEVMLAMPANSVDAIVTDPPYGLSDHKPGEVEACLSAWLDGQVYLPKGAGFMGKKWDAWVPGPEVWRAAFTVLKPGGHMLVFAGTRSMDLMCMAVRLAGFEMRDAIGYAHDGGGAPLAAWCYGSGFPKSLDVSGAIDKAGGVSPVEQAAVLRAARQRAGLSRDAVAVAVGCTTSSIRDWEEGRALAVGAAVEFITPSVKYRAELANLLGYTEDERRVVGVTTARAGDGSVIGLGHGGTLRAGGNSEAARHWQGWGTALKPAWEPVIIARKPLDKGTVAANVLHWGTGGMNIDACRVAIDPTADASQLRTMQSSVRQDADGWGMSTVAGDVPQVVRTDGRWPANLLHDGSEEVLATFPDAKGQQGALTGNEPSNKTADVFGTFAGRSPSSPRNDSGSAARFFYCAKASRAERNMGLIDPGPVHKHGVTLRKMENAVLDGIATGNTHATVKPIKLMRHLCRLVTPLGGVVLDPFIGSGSTGCAAVLEGFDYIGIERDAAYIEIARARIAAAKAQGFQSLLDD